MRTTWHGSICALLLVTLTILVGCASFPSASGAPITDIDQIAGKWAGTINPGHNGFEDPFYLTITPDRKLVAGWGVNTSWGTVTIRNGQATFECSRPSPRAPSDCTSTEANARSSWTESCLRSPPR